MSFLGDIFGGASEADKALAKDQKSFMDSLQTEAATAFQGQQGALKQVLSAWSPIIQGGPNQYGFSTAEDQALRGNIINAGQTAATNTENAALLREQQATGGAGGGPAGGQQAIDAQIAATGAQSTAAELGREKELGYETGREEFNTAQKGASEVAQIENPAGFANAASAAGGEANRSQNTVDTANANSLGAKLLGGVIQGGLAGVTGGIASVAGGGGFGAGFGQGLGG